MVMAAETGDGVSLLKKLVKNILLEGLLDWEGIEKSVSALREMFGVGRICCSMLMGIMKLEFPTRFIQGRIVLQVFV
jgi:hypothetical protein